MGAFDHATWHGYLVSLGRAETVMGSRVGGGNKGRYVVYGRRYIVLKGSMLVEYPSLQHAANYESRRLGGWRPWRQGGGNVPPGVNGQDFHLIEVAMPMVPDACFSITHKDWLGRREKRLYCARTSAERDLWFSFLRLALQQQA